MKKLFYLMIAMVVCGCRPPTPAQRPYQTMPSGGGSLLYVSPSGSDHGAGDERGPLATIAEALKRATPGSVIRLAPGVWNTKLEVNHRATREAPLTIEGARGSDGSWLSVLDGSTPVNPSLWKARPDLGPNVYSLPVEKPGALLVDGKTLARLHREAGHKSRYERLFKATEVFQWPDGKTVRYRDFDVPFWETIGGVYSEAVLPQQTVLRLADGSNPAQHEVALGSNGAVVTMKGSSFVTLKGVAIAGGEYGVEISGNEAIDNTVEECFIRHGRRRVLVSDGAQGTRIIGNRIEMGFIGYLTGAWGESNLEGGSRLDDKGEADAKKKAFVYNYFKYWASGASISDDVSIQMEKGSRDTLVENNRLKGGLVGISVSNGARQIKVIGNDVRHFSSVGTVVRHGVDTVLYDGNFFYDCNINLRLHEMNVQGPARRIWYLRNISMQPTGVGTHIFNHFLDHTPDYPEHQVVFAQNTFLGGVRGMAVPNDASATKGFPGYSFVNNRFIGCEAIFWAKSPFIETPGMLGGFDYNQVAGGVVNRHGKPVWQGAHCIESAENGGWKWDEHHVEAPADDPGRHAGIDLSRPYELGTVRFPAIPTFEPGYFKGSGPDLGAPLNQRSSSSSYVTTSLTR